MFQGRTADCNIRSWLHCRSLLCHCVPSCRYSSFQVKSREGSNCGRHCQEDWIRRIVEGSGSQDYYDWYADCSAMVYLRLCQGIIRYSPTTPCRNASISQSQARSQIIKQSLTVNIFSTLPCLASRYNKVSVQTLMAL
uniref:Uncharacterized protein n=1 Tax=Cacopsylla melanoneura TaxID=428564 RepID=A0A8D9AWK9_9HEMI